MTSASSMSFASHISFICTGFVTLTFVKPLSLKSIALTFSSSQTAFMPLTLMLLWPLSIWLFWVSPTIGVAPRSSICSHTAFTIAGWVVMACSGFAAFRRFTFRRTVSLFFIVFLRLPARVMDLLTAAFTLL